MEYEPINSTKIYCLALMIKFIFKTMGMID